MYFRSSTCPSRAISVRLIIIIIIINSTSAVLSSKKDVVEELMDKRIKLLV